MTVEACPACGRAVSTTQPLACPHCDHPISPDVASGGDAIPSEDVRRPPGWPDLLIGLVGAVWILFWAWTSVWIVAATHENCEVDACVSAANRGTGVLVVFQLGIAVNALIAAVARRRWVVGVLAIAAPLAFALGFVLVSALSEAADSPPIKGPVFTAPAQSPSSGVRLADDAASTDEDSVLRVPAPGVLGNDSDLDGEALTVTDFHTHSAAAARVVVSEDGAWTYDPTAATRLQALDDGDVFDDTFRYRASDGTTDRWAVVVIAVTGRSDR